MSSIFSVLLMLFVMVVVFAIMILPVSVFLCVKFGVFAMLVARRKFHELRMKANG